MKGQWVLRNKTSNPLEVLVPLNWKYCATHIIPVGGEVTVESDPEQVDLRSPLGTVGVLERKGKMEVQGPPIILPDQPLTKKEVETTLPKNRPEAPPPPPSSPTEGAPLDDPLKYPKDMPRRKRDEK